MLGANFWQDKSDSQKTIKEKKLFEDLVNSFKDAATQLKDLDDLYTLATDENNLNVKKEANKPVIIPIRMTGMIINKFTGSWRSISNRIVSVFVYTPNEYNELRTNSLTITSIINSLEVIFQDEEEVLS